MSACPACRESSSGSCWQHPRIYTIPSNTYPNGILPDVVEGIDAAMSRAVMRESDRAERAEKERDEARGVVREIYVLLLHGEVNNALHALDAWLIRHGGDPS